jgi:hypothetical protein
MTKHYTELGVGFANDPDSVNLHLCLPDHVLTKMDGVECAPDKTPLDNPHPAKPRSRSTKNMEPIRLICVPIYEQDKQISKQQGFNSMFRSTHGTRYWC